MEDFFSKPLVWVGFAFIVGFFIYNELVAKPAQEEYDKKSEQRQNKYSKPYAREKPHIEQILGIGMGMSILGFIIYFFQQRS